MARDTRSGVVGQPARESVTRACASGLGPRELLAHIADTVKDVVPHVHGAWLLTDPATMLFTDAIAENISSSMHLQFFENELFTPDFAKFTDIVRQPSPVAILSAATGGHPERSARHRLLHRPNGLAGELRAAFTTGSSCWGVACLARGEEEPDFTHEEAAFISSLCEHIAHGLRTALLLEEVEGASVEDAPGMVVLGRDHSVESLTPAAEHWLAELPREQFGSGSLELPSALHAVAVRARAAATGDGEAVPRARVRAPSGRWLLLHASCLREPSGIGDRVAVVIEPARRATLASITVELYELTEREQQVTQLLVRGLAIDEIAQTLWISRHTVRDHVKSIFQKLHVSTRPELTAKLFAEQFLPSFEDASKPVSLTRN